MLDFWMGWYEKCSILWCGECCISRSLQHSNIKIETTLSKQMEYIEFKQFSPMSTFSEGLVCHLIQHMVSSFFIHIVLEFLKNIGSGKVIQRILIPFIMIPDMEQMVAIFL